MTERVFADLVLLHLHAKVMAAHAGDAVSHGLVAARRVLHDLRRPDLETGARGVGQVVALQPVRQVEDDLAAVMHEAKLVGKCSEAVLRAEREEEEALPVLVAGEVEGFPIGAGG